jgi:hypothetical protein
MILLSCWGVIFFRACCELLSLFTRWLTADSYIHGVSQKKAPDIRRFRDCRLQDVAYLCRVHGGGVRGKHTPANPLTSVLEGQVTIHGCMADIDGSGGPSLGRDLLWVCDKILRTCREDNNGEYTWTDKERIFGFRPA